jgi:hypothetical protein
MDKPGQNPIQRGKRIKNSWMDNDIFVSAAVKAVEEGHSLAWSRVYRHGGSTFKDFKLASAWVYRERKKREFAASRRAAQDTRPPSIAAIALSEASLASEAERVERENRTHPNTPAPAESPEQKVTNWLKEFGLQLFGTLILIPVGIIFGFGYGGGLIAKVIAPLALLAGVVALLVGVVIRLFRFLQRQGGNEPS